MREGFWKSAVFVCFGLLVVSNASGATSFSGSANNGNCYPFNCNDSGSASGQAIDYEQVFSASTFGSAPILIAGITFFDEFLPGFGFSNVPLLSGTYTFYFAYTDAAVGGLSTNLASNIKSGKAMFLTVTSSGIAGGFSSLAFTGSTPFVYDPTLGNLLLEIVATNQANVSSDSYGLANGFDADDTGMVTSRAFHVTGSAASADSTGLVVQFDYTEVPEPASRASIAGGLVALLGWKKRKLLARMSGVAVAAVLAIGLASTVSAQPLGMVPRTIAVPLHTAGGSRFKALSSSSSPLSVPVFSRNYTINSTSYPQTFVGTDPATTNITTNITVPVIPVIIVIDNGNGTTTTFDPTKKLNTAPAGSALSATLGTLTSPLFQTANYTTGGINIGNGIQFGDAILRATFWDSVSTVSPNWHTVLKYQLKPAVTLNVPVADGSVSGPFAVVDLDWLGTQLDALAPNYGVTNFPLFVLYEVLQSQNNGGSCCVLGYHTALQAGANLQTYGMATYLDPNQIGSGAGDISVLSHEVSEWLNDPFVNNTVPDWPAPFSFSPPGPPYTPGSCQNNLETGDPIEDRVDPAKVNFHITTMGRQYTLQNEALAPWFLHVSPSFSVNGYYTYLGPIDNEFNSFAPACPQAP